MRLYALLLRLRLLAPVVSATSAPIVAITALASQSGCNRYVVKPQDTCWSVGQANNVTYAQLRSWNPEINLACSNLQTLTSICVSNPFGNFAMSTNVVSTTIATTPAPIPSPTAPSSNPDCGEWYFVAEGDSCSTITEKFSIDQKDFMFLNPQVWQNCTNLWSATYYCVEAVGTITTYSGYFPTTTMANNWIPLNATSIPYVDPFAGLTSGTARIPLANGTRKDCYNYLWFDNITDNMAADCWNLAVVYGITPQDLILWNPSLDNGNITVSSTTTVIMGATTTLTNNPYVYPCTLSESTSYCVLLSSPTPATAPVIIPPSPRAAGEVANCTEWYRVESYSTCDGIYTSFDLTQAQFYAMNPSTKSDCTGLAVGTYYCVSTDPDGMPPSEPDNDSTTTTVTTTTSTTQTGVSTPSPVQPGMVINCNRFYDVAQNDGCYAIAQKYALDLSQFYAWNPAVKTDCSGLQANVYVCIGVTAATTTTPTTTTTTATGIVTPTPTQSGMVSNCNRFYDVVLGDGCWAISQKYGISLDLFYAWNPAVKTDCSGLQASYYVCIGVTG